MKYLKNRSMMRFVPVAALLLSVLMFPACQDSLLNAPLGSATVSISQAPAALAGLDSATLTWKTDVEAVAWVEYGTLSGALDKSTVKTTAFVTDHSVDLSGLLANTTYYYVVKSTNQTGNSVSSAELSFTTGQLTIVGTVAVTSGASSATLSWTTNVAAISWIDYGTTSGSLDKSTVKTATPATSHGITLSGLSVNTTYYYVVHSTNAVGGTFSSTEGSFNSGSFSISSSPSATVSTVSASISWATSLDAVSWVEYGSTSGSLNMATVKTTTPSGTHAVVISGLSANTTYYYVVRSTHASGAAIQSTQACFTTTAFTILTTPSVIVSTTSASISWTTSENSVSWVEYGTAAGTYTNASVRTTTNSSSHGVTLNNLSTGTLYYYKVYSETPLGDRTVSPEYNFTTDSTVSTIELVAAPVATITAAPAAPAVVPDTTSASLAFSTNFAGKCIVEWGTVSGTYPYATSLEASFGTSHTASLTNLAWSRGAPSPVSTATYYYRIHSFSMDNKASISAEHSFVTPTITDATLSQRLRGIWLVGGVGNNNIASTVAAVELFDPRMGSAGTVYSANIPALPTPVSFAGIAGLNGNIYVFGGWLNTGAATNAIQIYNIATNTWNSSTYTLPAVRGGLNASAVGGNLYVYGGTAASTGGAWSAANVMWKYTINSATPTVLPAATVLAGGVSAMTDRTALTFNDTIYYLGGRITNATTLSTAHDGYTVNATGATYGATGLTEAVLSANRLGMTGAVYQHTDGQAYMLLVGGLATLTTGGTVCPALASGGTFNTTAISQYIGYPFISPDTWVTGANAPPQMAFAASAISSDGTKDRFYVFGGLSTISGSTVGANSSVYSSDLTTTTPFAGAWTTHALSPAPTARLGHAFVTVQ